MAEQAVKEAAEAMNRQLPEEAQGGSLQPLVEEKDGLGADQKNEQEEGKGEEKDQRDEQILDTFSVEIDAIDQVCSSCICNFLLTVVC